MLSRGHVSLTDGSLRCHLSRYLPLVLSSCSELVALQPRLDAGFDFGAGEAFIEKHERYLLPVHQHRCLTGEQPERSVRRHRWIEVNQD